MSLINFGEGLSAMGNAVAATAGTAAIEAQKADLDQQKEILASQLAEGRESRITAQKGQQDIALAGVQSQNRMQEYKAQKDVDISSLPAMAKAQDDILKAQASDPQYVKALRTMTDAKATPEQRAAAALYGAQTIGAKIQNATNQEMLDARGELKDAMASGDSAKVTAAQQRVAAAQYSLHDDVQRAATLAAQESNDRLQVQSLETQIAAKSIGTPGELPEQAQARAALVQSLQADLDVAKDNYATSHAMAQKAAQAIPAFNAASAPGTSSGGRPPLPSFAKPPAAPATPPPATTP